MPNSLIYKFLNDDDLLRISNKIKLMESATAGEIRVSVKEKRLMIERRFSVKDLAEKEFHRLGMSGTKDKTGILIFIILKDRQFYILADSGINEIVPEKTWDNIRDEMQQMLLEGKFCAGILHAVEKVGNILSSYFPIKPGDKNELSNKVIL